MIAYLINPKRRKVGRRGLKLHRATDASGQHTHVGVVREHLRRVNPKAKRKASTRAKIVRRAKRAARRTRRRFSAAQLAAQRRFTKMVQEKARLAREARRGSASVNPKRRTGGVSMARRKKSRRSAATKRTSRRRRGSHRKRARIVHHRNPRVRSQRRRMRRRHRRNPSFGTGSLLRQAQQGVTGGLAVLAGGGLSRLVASKVPFGQTSAIGRGLTQIVTGTVLGMVTKKVTRSERLAAFVVAGAYADVIRQNAASIPVVGQFLSGLGVYPSVLRPASRVGEYVRTPAPARPRLAGWAPRSVPAPDYAARMMETNQAAMQLVG